MRITSDENNNDDLDYYANELEEIILEEGI
jgi:hypothetical protein